MLKKNVKILAILVISLIIAFSSTFVLAQEVQINENTVNDATETDTDNEITTMNADEGVSIVESEEDDFKQQGDQYLSDDNVTVNTSIDGNVFILAKTAQLQAPISGDVFVMADTVEFTENCSVDGNIFMIAKNANINSSVMYSIYGLAENIDISGYIVKNVCLSVKDNINILGTIAGNANIFGTSKINFEDSQHSNRGLIVGSLKYSANEQIQIPEGVINGEVSFSKLTEKESTENPLTEHLFYIGCFLILLVAIWLACLGLAPKFTNNSAKLLKTKILPVILFGIISLIIIPILAFALLFTPLTLPASFIVALVYLLLLVISTPIFLISLNNVLCENFKINGNGGKFIELLILGALYYVIGLIPFIGVIVKLIALILGLGLIITSIMYNRNKSSKTQSTK